MLNIIACVKVVTDPEAPASIFKIDPAGRHAVPGQGVPPVLNPYDENSLEAALRIKERQASRITVISAGKSLPKAVVKKSLAVGADELVIIEDGYFEDVDGYTTAVFWRRPSGNWDCLTSFSPAEWQRIPMPDRSAWAWPSCLVSPASPSPVK